MNEKLQVLQQYFGYTSFREGQESLIDAILEGRDALGVMPTGAGKSLCFQIPALLREGVTLVISPLISLMKDQVGALTQNGVRAAYLNSSLTPAQYRNALENARQGVYKIIYIAPERLMTRDFQEFVQDAVIPLVAVDEAHCVSQWGQDFRASYLDIPRFIASLPCRPVVCALTATATPKVREDIIRLLELREPFSLLTGFDRKNLYFEVQRPKNKRSALLRLLQGYGGKSGIIYCSTRKNVEQVCDTLQEQGYPVTRYHAGLGDRERKENQETFLYDKSSVMVATNAFGMGIDKSNVSFVIHYNMPKDLESYYQEAGRAGRDGEPADCILLYSGQDVITNRFLLEHSEASDPMEPEARALLQEQNARRLKAMTFYCHTNDCLRTYILRYFGETSANFCGNCFNCNHLFETMDITIPAQKILSCIKRTGERYGFRLIAEILRGGTSDRLISLGLGQQSTYGLLADLSEARLREIINFLTLENYLAVSDGQYPILGLGKRAGEVLIDRAPLVMKLAKEPEPGESRRAARKNAPGETGQHRDLFERLRTLRTELATEEKVPPYLVFSNAALEDMCAKLPRSLEAFLTVSGVGKRKRDRYGEAFLAVIQAFLDEA